MQVDRCRVCKKKEFKTIFSLGNQPIANNLLDNPETVKVFPLELIQCTYCRLIQLNYVVPKEDLYEHYAYIPSVSKTQLKHFERLADDCIASIPLKEQSLVVDIGGNDGSLLSFFKERGMRVVNVEPAKNLVEENKKRDIPLFNDYFTQRNAFEICQQYGKAKLVIATNSFAHIDDLYGYLVALDILLDDNGVFIAQFPNVHNLLRENQFDTIYHEHLSYFSQTSLYHLFKNSPFEIYRIDNTAIHGGSMRIYVRRRVPPMYEIDESGDLIKKFVVEVEKNCLDLVHFLKKQKEQGKCIVAFGAAAKGIVLLNYCKLDRSIIDYIADGTPYKQGKYAPGVHIPIVPEEELLKRPPDIVLILAWNFKEEILDKLKGRGYTFVIQIPKVEVIHDR